MDSAIYFIIAGLAVVCGVLVYFLTKNSADKHYTHKDLQNLLEEEKQNLRKEVLAEIEVNYNQSLEKADLEIQKAQIQSQKNIQEEERKLRDQEFEVQNRLSKKEEKLELKLQEVESQKYSLEQHKSLLDSQTEKLQEQAQNIKKREAEILGEISIKLEQISGLTQQEAKQQLIERTTKEIGQEVVSLQSKIVEQAKDEANIKARNIVSLAIQRCSSDVANEMTVTVIKLNSEDDKGKLIGKGGRNIQWLEKTLGVELIIDDTPGIITISGFSGIRRHIAKKTLEKLLDDGRVHPSSIEEMYEKAKSELAMEVQYAGEETVAELGIIDFPPKLVRILGRLKFRTSYGQNMLKHSLEMAKLAGLLVDEINSTFKSKFPIDREICVKGALLHDIGKAVDEEQMPKGNHIELGEKICDMFGLDWKIRKCISSHHETGGDVQSYHDAEKGFCIEACIVDACDNISGSRPGARKETTEAYFQRMESLERIANSVPGVLKSFIMRGSRELWVFFDPETTDLVGVSNATREIVRQINDSIKSPFKIQVNAFLETRLVEYAG